MRQVSFILLMIIIFMGAGCQFNQHHYTQEVLYVISNKAVLEGKNIYKKLRKGDFLINLGKSDGKYKARFLEIKFYGGPMIGGGTKSYTGWIDAKYVKPSLVNKVVYSKKIIKKKMVIFQDSRIGWVPGVISIGKDEIPVGQGFPLVEEFTHEGSKTVSFELPNGKIIGCNLLAPYGYIKKANWDTEKNQLTLQSPIPNYFWQFIYSTLFTNLVPFLVFWAVVVISYFIFSFTHSEPNNKVKSFKTLIMVGIVICSFQSCGHRIYLDGVKTLIPADIRLGNGVQIFWTVFYIPVLFSLIGFSFIGVARILILASYRRPFKEAIMKREKQKEHKRYKSKIRDIENQEERIGNKLIRLTEESPEIAPEIIEYIPKDTGLYKGVIREIARRMQEGQIKKTIRATKERIEEGRKFAQELTALQRAKADLKRSISELKMVDIEIAIKEKKTTAEYERVDLESDVEKLEIEARKSEVEDRLNEIKQRRETKDKPEISRKTTPEEAVKKKGDFEEIIIEEKLRRETNLKKLYDGLKGIGYTHEEAQRRVEEERQRLDQMALGNL